MTTPEVMGRHASKHDCFHRPYNQMTELGLAKGICFGLAVCWLKAVHDNGEDNYFAEVRVPCGQNNQMYRIAHGYWRGQNTPIWRRETGLYQAQGKIVTKTFYATLMDGFENENMGALTRWLCAAAGTRYFLLHVGTQNTGHTMAATGCKLGRLRFFDPNGGVVSTMWASRLTGFMNDYFNDEHIKPHYKDNSGRVVVTAEKFKM